MKDGVSKVVVGIPVNIFPAVDRKFYKNKELQLAETSMCNAVRRAGGLPVILPLTEEGDVAQLVEMIDGLLLAGGADIAPAGYGETPDHPDWAGQPERDRFEVALYHASRERKKPVLGVCRGIQMINVAEGGSLWQDLVTQREGSEVHRSQELYDELGHSLRVESGTVLHEILGAEELEVNTIHHQGLKEIPSSLIPLAWSPDGIVEAVVHRDAPFTLGVQWHPEWMADTPEQRAVFRRFIEEIEASR